MIAYCGPKILKSGADAVEIKIPLIRRTKNHLNSMYFGALSVGADFTAGLLVLNNLRKHNSNAKLIFKDFQANFIKRALSDVIFVCDDFKEVENSVRGNIKSKQRVNFKVKVQAFCAKDLIADFVLTTSIK